jgi:hypothetical protein
VVETLFRGFFGIQKPHKHQPTFFQYTSLKKVLLSLILVHKFRRAKQIYTIEKCRSSFFILANLEFA